jgi:hypothetical protein
MSLFNRSPQAQFGKALQSKKAAYRGPAGMPMFDRSTVGVGSKGGSVIWGLEAAFMPTNGMREELIHRARKAKTGSREAAKEMAADPDGFAVFGRYPQGFLAHVLKSRLLGDVQRDDILHVCSGTLSSSERWTVDIRPAAKPSVIANGIALPFSTGAFAAVMIDPPYSDEYAHNLYGTENPRPAWLLKEAARVVRPGGMIGILHVAIPFSPPRCFWRKTYGITTGLGYRIRAFTVFQREQDGLYG